MIDFDLPFVPPAPVNDPTIARLKDLMHLFELAGFMRGEGILPRDLPTGWHDLHPWIQSNNWGHPGGIPLPTLDKLITRLQQRLEEVDPTESQIAALTQ